MTREGLLQFLGTIIDPLTGQNLVLANRIQDIKIDDQRVQVMLSFPPKLDSNIKSEINFKVIEEFAKIAPGLSIDLHFGNPEPAQKKSSNLPQIKNIIAVASGKGGVGKSTISVNLALGLKQAGLKVGILDADLYGPSIPIMLGLKGKRPEVKQVYGVNKIIPLQAYGLPVMSIGFVVEPEQAVVLRGPRLAGVMKQFLEDCLWPELDVLVIDLPPGTGDIQLTLVQTVPVTGAIIVTTPQQVSVADAIKAANMFQMDGIGVPILGIVENMSWFTPAELPDKKYEIFGKGGGQHLAGLYHTVLLQQIPLVLSVRAGGDEGRPSIMDEGENDSTKYFKSMAANVLDQLNLRNENMAPTQKVVMKN
ncbi:MAG: Mrp/NBP35 family ATP-binding protein [Saprospiraceae bacterium]|jgi:ATP-binding protein involved in chromosome partitioning|nr:Mrp/NBP35 family ATP-binding protein [Saprospiraceae bacterium]MBK7369922.1 Mrp/NBP35 family ATP-binding protein [Saprospiraceae bacterium]MBK7437625.1 Mrp/NBP35 family ATP-binding protein [Saprospiraceae bacterium]MBK8512323.1 Mrp/NBP35 family ATP-binding protein [Saprospiraceae bacterium]MBK8776540.1 Mrp/NBP35 family ATP-binding protein [Saprospiraceae bacterium]